MRLIGDLFRGFVIVVVLILTFYFIDAKTEELYLKMVLGLSVLSVLSLSLFVFFDNFKEEKYLQVSDHLGYFPNWVILLLPFVTMIFKGRNIDLSLKEIFVALLLGLLLIYIIINVSLKMLNYRKYYYLYITFVGIVFQLYIIFFSNSFEQTMLFSIVCSLVGILYLVFWNSLKQMVK